MCKEHCALATGDCPCTAMGTDDGGCYRADEYWKTKGVTTPYGARYCHCPVCFARSDAGQFLSPADGVP